MKKMKRMILKTLLLLLCAVWNVGASAQEGAQYLALNIGGEAVFISLADNPVITYSGNALHIATEAGESYDVEVEDINRGLFTTTQEIPTSLGELAADKPSLRAGMLLFDHLKAGSTVRLLTADGKVVGQTQANADGKAVFNLSQHPKGAYVVRTATQSFKIAIK